MSDYRYKFVVSIGFSGADHEVEYDLVEDFGEDPEDLEDENYLNDILDETLRQELDNVNDSFYEKIED